MRRWPFGRSGALVALISASLFVGSLGLVNQAATAGGHPATGVGSCTLKGWNPTQDPAGATSLPIGKRPQTYRPDNYNCTGAKFAAPGVEFRKFPQPHNFRITNRPGVRAVAVCRAGACRQQAQPVLAPTGASNPLAPYFPPFTHFVVIMRENHTFDDYLGDCATTIQAGCNGQVMSPNHISSVPNLHTLATTYALDDSYSTGTQPPSGPNHWWLFTAQSQSSSQQQSYPTATGTQFDRFLTGTQGPSGEGTNPCTAQTGTGTGSSPYTMMMAGDFYWMLSSGSGYWRNPKTGNVEVLPVQRPGTSIPEELNYNEYSCSGQNISDTTIANNYMNFVSANGLPAYSYVELFNDHPGTYQNIPTNDAATKSVVDSIMNNASYKDNTLIVVTEDDTQNGNNGPDHVSNTYRVPLVVIGSPTYVKQHYLSHVAYTTSNVIAAMERVMQNVHPGIIDPNNNIGLSTFPMTTADQSALGDPLGNFWVQGSTPLSATAAGAPSTGNAPLNVSFTGSASGGTAPYSYSWNFGDGSPTSTQQNPSHTYSAACTCTATLTVTDSSSPANTATATVTTTVSAVGKPLAATATATPTSGQIPLNVAFTGTGTGGTPPYSYSWNFGDGSAASTQQNPSHTYNAQCTCTATLTVTDSSSPAQTATSSVTITASPIAGAPPGPPTGLTASAGSGQVSLSWTAPSSNGGVSITSYKVYRGTSPGQETLVTSGGCSGLGAVLSCTDSGLANGQTYYYKVSAVNAIGEGNQSNEASATPATGTSPLSQNFDASTTLPAGWTATGLWRVGSDCLGAASAPNSLQFNSASTCTYNPLPSSGYATSPAFDISAAPAPTLTFSTKYQVESYSGHTDVMTVQAKTATGSWTTLWTRDSTNPAQTTFGPVSLGLSGYKSAGSQIRFSFNSVDSYARSYPGWAIDDVAVQAGTATAPGAPTGLTASAGSGQVSLSWTAPSSNGGAPITSYKVYRGTSPGTETLVPSGGCSGLGAVLSCTDSGLANGQTYYYKVSAVNSVGEGGQSSEASATPAAPTSPLSQNFDASTTLPAGWTATGLWRVGSNCLGAASPPNSLQFNSASTCDYNPLPSSGYATSPAFDISAAPAPTLTFNTKYQVESYSGHTDVMTVQARTAGGSWTTLWTRDSTNPAQTIFGPVSLGLSGYKSAGTQIRFSFNSVDSYPRSHPGWAVDDVVVKTGAAAGPRKSVVTGSWPGWVCGSLAIPMISPLPSCFMSSVAPLTSASAMMRPGTSAAPGYGVLRRRARA